MHDDKTIDTGIDNELTLVDIDELREALGAEAELTSNELNAAPESTVMCPQWY
ncbi:hypothetical protein [Paraliomyxa miuraensis]|uniref:hypothetical protein n=1 Tax=Paraliomyxa miuraensis TaxID=376150 RepID=UPI00224EC394|nr:hypothetical protein [Paraliomyxa miuraensis]MCX4247481.1 hypothetical protein [Paraliomyxa miuraensis]